MPKRNVTDMRRTRMEERRRADDRFTWRVLGVMLFLTVWVFLLFTYSWPVTVFAAPAGAAALYLLAFIYPRDFTALGVLISGGALGLWLLTALEQPLGWRDRAVYILFAAAILAAGLLIWLLKKKNGVISLGKISFCVMPRKGRYVLLFAACGALAASLAATAVFGRPAALISVIALFCYLFIAAVYYTVKLI